MKTIYRLRSAFITLRSRFVTLKKVSGLRPEYFGRMGHEHNLMQFFLPSLVLPHCSIIKEIFQSSSIHTCSLSTLNLLDLLCQKSFYILFLWEFKLVLGDKKLIVHASQGILYQGIILPGA